MTRLAAIIATILSALVSAHAQNNLFPQTLPPNTVVGRLGIGPGPAQAIPFATFQANILGASVASPEALASTVLSPLLQYINVISMSAGIVAGQQNCGLAFYKGTATPLGIYGEVLNSPSGLYWEPLYSTSPVKACEFGTIGDGTFAFGAVYPATNTVTGTDNTPMLQAALDYAMQNRFESVCISDGKYKTTKALQVGYGVGQIGFVSLALVACNNGRVAYGGNNPGVTLYPTASNQCAINMQGMRDGAIRRIAIIGQNYSFSASVFVAAPIPITASGWLDPNLVPTGSNSGGVLRFAPYAGVCTDPHYGVAPATPYPNVVYPTWLSCSPSCSQYGVTASDPLPSSNIELTDLDIEGFPIGIVNQPNGDANGDFTQIAQMNCTFAVYCISVGNSQSRNFTVKDSNFSGVYTWLTTSINGAQAGTIGGPISNISGGHGYQFFLINNMDGVGPLELNNLYAEAQVRIGQFANNGLGSTVTINNLFLAAGDYATGVVPVAQLESTGSYPVNFIIRNSLLNNIARIQQLVHGNANVIADGGVWTGCQLQTTYNEVGLQIACNYTGGIFSGTAQTFPFPTVLSGTLKWQSPTRATYMSGPTTVLTTGQAMGPNADFFSGDFTSRAPFTQATTGFVDAQNQQWTFAAGLAGTNAISGQLTSTALSACNGTGAGGVLTGNWLQLSQEQSGPAWHFNLGDILYQNNDGTFYAVTAVGALSGGQYPITARQQNNMTINSSGQCVASNAASLAGAWTLVHTGGGLVAGNPGGIFIPQRVYFGDFANGSTAVTNIGGDGSQVSLTNMPTIKATTLDTFIQNGDHIWNYQYYSDPVQHWPYAIGVPLVTSLSGVTDGTPGSLTLSLAATLSGRFPILPLPVLGAPGTVTPAISRLPVVSASGGTCAVTATPTSGNQVRGAFALTGACAAGNTITLTFAINAPTGWFCNANTRVSAPVVFNQNGAGTATTAVMTPAATTGATDVVGFECAPY